MQDRTQNAARNVIFGALLKAYQILIPFIMRTIIIYLLGAEYAGLSSLFTSILQVLNLAELGVGAAMVYSMYKPIAENDSARICALLKMYKIYYRIIGMVIAAVGIALTPVIPRLVKGEVPSDINLITLYYLNLGAVVVSYWLFAYKSSLLQAHQRADVVSKVVIVTNTLQYLLQFVVLFAFRNYYYFVIVALATQVISNIATAVAATKMYPDYQPCGELDVKEKIIINNKIKDLFFIRIGSIVVDSVDSIVISAFLGLTMLAVYQNYFYIMNSVYMLVCTVFTAIVASVGNSLITESDEKNYSDFKTLTFIMSAIICVCCNCFVGLYQPFMKMWVGETLMLEFPFVILLCVYFYVRLTASIWNVPKDAAGLWHSDRYRALVAAGVNLTLNLIFVNIMGLYGILLSTIIAVLFISCPWILHNVFKYIYKRSMKRYLLKIAEYALCSIVSCLISYFACGFLHLEGILGLVERLIATVIISCCMILILFSRTEEWNRGMRLAVKMLKRGAHE
ncbi:polysaccharide biosynthesis protein [Butyrivibrio fibrisolvens]|uniref:polysaccharide biosynthesis protein n=1 Tax=Butyrivibrio fibrisolvens TaxID=831 RepID=UPI000428CAAA|nr:polysaccharide biosynthesis protein [Butyrivibrio fibrisolvens]